jgi:hypothetical protein
MGRLMPVAGNKPLEQDGFCENIIALNESFH